MWIVSALSSEVTEALSDNRFYEYSNSQGTHANHPTRSTPKIIPHLVPSHEDGSDVPGCTGRSEPNFLDLALEESDEDSDDEWEEVTYATNNTAVDKPLIAIPSEFTLPVRGKRSEFLTLEVVEDWQPLPLPSASHTDGPQTAPPEDVDRPFTQELTSAEDDPLEADLQLERELAQGLADLKTPAPGPPRQLRSPTPDVANSAANASPSPRPPVHLKLEVVERPSPARTSVKGKGRMVDPQPVERLHKTGKRADPPRVSLAIEDPPTRKPTVSFKAKASELARSAGRLLTASKPHPSRNLAALPPFSTTGGPSYAPHPRVQATSDLPGPTPQLFTSKGFSHHVQNLREKTAGDTLRRFHERYGGETVGYTGRDLAGPIPASKGTQPTQRRQVQRTAGGKRISKAQAQAEEVTKICRSTKSYIVDVAAIKRRQVPTAPVIASQRVSKTQSQAPLPIPQLPPQLLSASLGSVPRGLKFTKKQKPAPEPGEITTETVGNASDRDVREPRLTASSGGNGPLMMGVSKRRRENSGMESEGSSPRKKPRLGRS